MRRLTLPAWVPRWVAWLFGIATGGGDPVLVIECSLCGALIDIPQDADEIQCDIQFNNHFREAHGDAA